LLNKISSGRGISSEQTAFGWSQGIGACCRAGLDELSQGVPQGFDEDGSKSRKIKTMRVL
jgi:hypothetical protein